MTQRRPLSGSSPGDEGIVHSDAWREELGENWVGWVPIFALLIFTMGASAPLADIDLPMHLATGAWIVKQHAVPFVEPFAWTRAGAPFYAYSWLPEVIYFLSYAYAGPLLLRTLHGLTLATGGLALLWVARTAGWRAWTAVQLCFLSLFVEAIVFAYLRPQALLFPAVLLAWGCGLRVLNDPRPASWVVLLVLIAAVSANSHLLFPLTALPLAIAISRTPFPLRRGALIAGALLCGWLLTPYALYWPEIFRLYFGHNLLFDYPSPISEVAPGFRTAAQYGPLALAIAVLAIAPSLVRYDTLSTRARLTFSSLWLIGLFGYGLAARALVVWWIATLPLLVLALDRIPAPRPRIRIVMLLTMASFPLLLGFRSLRLAHTFGGGIASPVAMSVEPLATWLDEHARPSRRPRVLTSLNYGSYLNWRLPDYSMSVDGRTIFPDSAAAPDAYRLVGDERSSLGPWQTADLAILPVQFPAAKVLDTAQDWVRIDTVAEGPDVPMSLGLWCRRSWLSASRR